MSEWTLFSNHGHVLVCLANNNEARLRDVAAEVGITERAVQNILRELQHSGIVQVNKHGRCNHYQINTRKSLRHPLEAHCSVGKLLALLKSADSVAVTPETVVSNNTVEKAAPSPKAAPKSQTKPLATAPAIVEVAVPEPQKVQARVVKDQQAATPEMKVGKSEDDLTEAGNAASKKSTAEMPKSVKSSKKDEPPSTPQGSLF